MSSNNHKLYLGSELQPLFLKSRKAIFWLLLLILIVGAALRFYAVRIYLLPFGDNDGCTLELAKNLLEGRGYVSDRKWFFFAQSGEITHVEANRQPLLTFLVAGVFYLCGENFLAAKSITFLLGMFSIWLTFLIGKRLFNSEVGLISALFTSLNAAQIWFSANLSDQILLQFILLLAVFLTLKFWQENKVLNPKIALYLGVLCGLAYLSRTDGILLVPAGILFFLLNRGSQTKKLIPSLIIFLFFFSLIALPWWLHNIKYFGNPLYSTNKYFLYDEEDIWKVFSVNFQPYSIARLYQEGGLLRVLGAHLKGLYRVIEPFIIGNEFRTERFHQGGMVLFCFFGLVAMFRYGNLKRDSLMLFSFILTGLMLTAHQHVFRYLLAYYILLIIFGVAGFLDFVLRFKNQLENKTLNFNHKKIYLSQIGVLFLLLSLAFFPYIRSLRATFDWDEKIELKAALETVNWLKKNTLPENIIMEFRFLERLIYLYERPTVITPFDDPETVFETAYQYKVNYFILHREIFRFRNQLEMIWCFINGKLQAYNLPEYLKPIWVDPYQRYYIYQFNRDTYHYIKRIELKK